MIKIKIIGDLIPSGNFVVHSKFKNVVNFVNSENELLSISLNVTYLSPNSIILESIDIQIIEKIEINKNEILINNLKFETSKINKFDSYFNFPDLHSEYIINSVIYFLEDKIKQLSTKSLIFLIEPENEIYFESKFEQAYVNYMKLAFAKFLDGNIVECAKLMKGAGFGLTPGGDDFIAGMLIAIHVLESNFSQNFSDLRIKIMENSLGKNLISNSLLIFSTKGAIFKRFYDFLFSFVNDNNSSIEPFNMLISIGETSGSDMLAGFLIMLKHRKLLNNL